MSDLTGVYDSAQDQALLGKVYVKDNLTCTDPVETPYYSSQAFSSLRSLWNRQRLRQKVMRLLVCNQLAKIALSRSQKFLNKNVSLSCPVLHQRGQRIVKCTSSHVCNFLVYISSTCISLKIYTCTVFSVVCWNSILLSSSLPIWSFCPLPYIYTCTVFSVVCWNWILLSSSLHIYVHNFECCVLKLDPSVLFLTYILAQFQYCVLRLDPSVLFLTTTQVEIWSKVDS